MIVPDAARDAAAKALAWWNDEPDDIFVEAWQEGAEVALAAALPIIVAEVRATDPLRARIEALANYWEATPSQRLSGWLIAHDLRAALDDTADTTRSDT